MFKNIQTPLNPWKALKSTNVFQAISTSYQFGCFVKYNRERA